VDDVGHAPQFPRVLRRFALFAVAFSIVSITTGIFLNYSYGITQMGPAAVWLWPVATVGQLFVVLVLAELAGYVPLAGANYQWAARLVDARFGYLVGALGVLYGAVGVPGIALLGLAPLTATVLGLDAEDGRLLVFIAVLALVIAYLINVVRVQLAARVNNVAVFTEIIGTVVLSVVVFVAWVRGGTPDGHGFGFLFTVSSDQPFASAVVGGALIGVFTLVGFEAAADMAEEAVDARRTVPRAMIISLVVSGVLGMVALVGFTIAIPDLASVASSPVPLAAIAEYWLGPVLTRVFLALVVFSMFALIVIAAASNSRLIFAMARDGMLPFSGLLRRVNPRTNTPVPALVGSLVVCLVLLAYGTLDGNAFAVLVGATALVPYLVYLLTLGGYLARRGAIVESGDGGFQLGAAAKPIAVLALLWLLAVVAALTLPDAFRDADYVVLGALVLAGIWYVAALRRRLADGTAGLMAKVDA
jgi:amino acid transporter